MQEIYTVKDVAELMKVSEYTVRRWIKEGRLKGFKPANEWRFTEKDIERFIESSRTDSKGE